MNEPIKNPGDYSERKGTNVRLEPKLKKAMVGHLEESGQKMADYINSLVEADLKAKGIEV